uniref:(northern house mosquito) hypothetical protein n=1 Tax=Culex pipiens TaxID=7175 RepID=A0A8D7ZWI2_CULPI
MKKHTNLLKHFVSLCRSSITTGNSNKSVACSASLNLPQHSSLKIDLRRTLGLELMPIRDHFRKWSELMAGFDSNIKVVLVQTSFGMTISQNFENGITLVMDVTKKLELTRAASNLKAVPARPLSLATKSSSPKEAQARTSC